MLSLIEVMCPHCGARGQVMLPPVGTIIMGPCPQCQGLVVVFCGHVLALDKEIMFSGSVEEKRAHILAILMGFLKERIEQMISDGPAEGEEQSAAEQEESEAGSEHEHDPLHRASSHAAVSESPISEGEAVAFSSIELKLLDNREYFKAIFG